MFKRGRLLPALVTTAGCIGLWTCVAQAQDATSARQFMESVYNQYVNDGDGIGFMGPHAAQYYHSSLIALETADEKAVGAGEVGAVDGDPICACQDWEGIFDLHIDTRMQGRDRAVADVSFAISKPEHRTSDDVMHLVFALVLENGQWRIWNIRDVSDAGHPFDVRAALNAEIEKLKGPRTQRATKPL